VEPLEDPDRLPIAQPSPAGHAGAAAHGLGQARPGDAGAEHEDDALERLAVVERRPASLQAWRSLGKQRRDQRPERVGNERFGHPPRLAVPCRPGEVLLRALALSKGSLIDCAGGWCWMDNRLLVFARLALAVAERVVPDRANRFAPRRYRQPQLLACILVKEHLSLDYRTAEELIAASDGLRVALGLAKAPDHSTLWWFARRRLDPDRLASALAEAVRCVQREPRSEPSRVALDSTGLWLS
jgi:hypothetical protein